jgi:hypothetical protein
MTLIHPETIQCDGLGCSHDELPFVPAGYYYDGRDCNRWEDGGRRQTRVLPPPDVLAAWNELVVNGGTHKAMVLAARKANEPPPELPSPRQVRLDLMRDKRRRGEPLTADERAELLDLLLGV